MLKGTPKNVRRPNFVQFSEFKGSAANSVLSICLVLTPDKEKFSLLSDFNAKKLCSDCRRWHGGADGHETLCPSHALALVPTHHVLNIRLDTLDTSERGVNVVNDFLQK